MNSYGSMSRVSESIYKMLRYMNWVPVSESDDTNELNHPDIIPSGS
jgi:hypothetical protein